MMTSFLLLVVLCLLECSYGLMSSEEIECDYGTSYNTTASAYYPDFQSSRTRDFVDEHGEKLQSLQEYLDFRSTYVTVAMDASLGMIYGTSICIPELNRHYGRYIYFEVRDTSPDIFGCKYNCIEIAVRTESDSYDTALNRHLTMVVIDEQD